MNDKRIGTMSDEKIEWPTQTISGQPFDESKDRKRGVTTITLARGFFAVQDTYPVPNQDAIIVELIELITPKTSKAVKGESSNG